MEPEDESPHQKEMNEMVANIFSSMNKSVDPCIDFYEYSCGNWGEVNLRPAGYNELYWEPSNVLDHQEAAVLHDILMENSYTDDEIKITYAKILYQNCVGNGPTSYSSITSPTENIKEPPSVNEEVLESDDKQLSILSIRHSCLEIVKTIIGRRWIEKLYLSNIFLDRAKIGKVNVMARNIQRSMGDLIAKSITPLTGDNEQKWMVKSQKIKHFLKKVKPCIGYFKNLLDEDQSIVESTDTYYAYLSEEFNAVNSTDYLYEDREDRSFACYWQSSPFYWKGVYNFVGGSFELTYNVIQAPYFEHNRPRAMNYGAIGTIIGHELAHSIEIEEYQETDDLGPGPICMVHQYSEFSQMIDIPVVVHGTKIPKGRLVLDGKETLKENFADNLGLRAAFQAYKKLPLRFKKNLVPGLKNFSDEQLFFLSYAQAWCSEVSEEQVAYRMMKDDHSPPKFRILGTLQNSKEFSAAFKCPLGSPMNPPEKCELV